MTSIGDGAFGGCYGLTSVTIGNSVTSIGNEAFYYCSGLTSITIPNSVTSIDDYAFYCCSGLTSINVDEGNTIYDSRDNCNAIIRRASNALIVGCRNTTIPNSVTSIGDYAFYYCSGLTSINVDEGNTIYDSRDNCNAIIEKASNTLIAGCRNTTIPNSVTSIGDNTFCFCSGLTSITIPNSVTSIGRSAFACYTALTNITIPNSVTSIGNSAFCDCSGLTDVYCYAKNVPTTNSNPFYGSSYNTSATLHVPASSIESYQSVEPWKDFANMVAIPESLKCATPTITSANGKVRFACVTEGVEFVPTVTCTPNQLQNGNELELGGTFTVSVYAVKDGYDNSDTATMTINMSQMGDVNADGEVNAADITAVVNAILGKQ